MARSTMSPAWPSGTHTSRCHRQDSGEDELRCASSVLHDQSPPLPDRVLQCFCDFYSLRNSEVWSLVEHRICRLMEQLPFGTKISWCLPICGYRNRSRASNTAPPTKPMSSTRSFARVPILGPGAVHVCQMERHTGVTFRIRPVVVLIRIGRALPPIFPPTTGERHIKKERGGPTVIIPVMMALLKCDELVEASSFPKWIRSCFARKPNSLSKLKQCLG
jgi:hypothetical protein